MNLHRPMRPFLFGLVLALVLSACGGGAEPTGTPVPPTATLVPPAPTATSLAVPEVTRIPGAVREPQPTPVGEPQYGGDLSTTFVALRRLDVHLDQTPAAARDVGRAVFNGLLRYDIRTDSLQPDLAETWTIDSDTSITFKIRQGVKFQNKAPVNGRAFTAEDVKWNLERMRDNPESILRVFFATVDRIDVIDNATVRLTLNQFDANILFTLAFEKAVIFAEEAAVDGTFDQVQALIGTGPFFADAVSTSGQSRFSRNPTYWRKDGEGRALPYVDSLTALMTVDAASRAAAAALMKTGQLDFHKLRSVDNIEFVKSNGGRIVTGNTLVGDLGIYFNVNVPPFTDKRLREAVVLLVNQQQILQLAYEGLAFISGPIGTKAAWGHWSKDKLLTLPGLRADKTEDIARAKQLLAAAGVPNGFNFDVWDRGNPSNAEEVIDQQLLQYGIKVTHKAAGVDVRFTDFAADKQSTNGSKGSGITPDYSVSNTWISTAPQNGSNWFNPQVDALYLQQLGTKDNAARFQILDQIQEIVWNDYPYVPLPRSQINTGIWPWVQNFFGTYEGAASWDAAQFEEVWTTKS